MQLKEPDRGEERFRLAVEAAANAMVMVDGDGRIVLVNTQTERLFGYVREELLGQPVEILLPEPSRSRHPPFRREFFTHLKKRPMGAGVDLYARRKNGSQLPVEIGLNPIEGAEGTWVLCSIVDISERLRAEEHFRLAVEASPSAMVMVSHEGKIVMVNSQTERLFGYQKEELLGRPIEILVPESSRKSHRALREGFSSAPQVRPMGAGRDLQARRKDGSQVPVEIALNPIETPEGTWVLTSIVDATFHRQKLHQLKLENVGILAGGIAHDFNNLLGSILADTELALSELAAGSQPLEEINNIRTVAIRAAEIVRQLMTHAGQEKVHREPVDVSWLVQEMLGLLKVSISKNANIRTDLGKDLPAVLGSAPQLRQVVMNLILNASEAIGEKGVIYVATSHVTGGRNLAPADPAELPHSDYLRLEVSDTGSGMTNEDQARVFDPFFSTKSTGRGQGLAVVQEIVHAHGGAINMVSAQGHGTTLQVLLPCARASMKHDDIAVVPPIDTTMDTTIAGAVKTVLLVEDEDALRLPVAKMLRNRGFSVIEAADGSAAIDTVRSQSATVDVILLDITIPGVSSLEVLVEARRIRPDIKVILTSAYSLDMVPFPADAPMITGFIRKPFQLSELVRLLLDVLSVQERRRAGG